MNVEKRNRYHEHQLVISRGHYYEEITFAVLLTTYNNRYVMIKNRDRGGWEIPGGRREAGESIVQTACRELYEETGAVHFKAAPFGVFPFNDTYGMAFAVEVIDIQDTLPANEIEDIQYVKDLPDLINFHDLVHSMLDRWNQMKEITEPHFVEYRIKIS
ncbi:NUDIX domain-containing protein [Paenibacillus sp. 1001270B_150601_E10]|uniref:NUDIX domain-containing protein n=1 Tax=Paenibacillus sp. 1001270B_150601_E10 TaxID=2787079 RepID=UPI00189EAA04|nr:NUDIX hydrolase [Paenibacillus sp. 1001270B_150601_E10]